MSLRPYVAYVRTQFRVLRRDSSEGQSTALLVGLLAGFAYVLVQPGGKGAYYYGRQFADGATVGELTALTTRMTMVTILVFSFLMYRNMVKAAKFSDRSAFVATAVPRRTQITSLLLYQFAFFALLLVGPIAIAALAFAIGAGAPLSAISLTVSGVSLLATASALTFPLGLLANYPIQRYEVPDAIKYALGILALLGLEAVFVYRETLTTYFLGPPFSWFVDLALVFVPDVRTPLFTVALALSVPLLIFPVTVLVSVRLIKVVWFQEGPSLVDGTSNLGPEVIRTDSPLYVLESIGLSSRTLSLISLTWRRSRRSLFSIGSALLAVLFIGLLGYQSMTDGTLPPRFTVFVPALAATGAGVTFTLNPLGYDADVFPELLTSRLEVREYVLGRGLAVAFVSVPATLLIASASIALTPTLSLIQIGATLCLALLISAVAPFVALCVGSLLPNYQEGDVLRGMTVALPSHQATVLFVLVLLAVYAPGASSTLLLNMSPPARVPVQTLVTGFAMTIGGVALLADLSYRRTINQIGRVDLGDKRRSSKDTSLRGVFDDLRSGNHSDTGRDDPFGRSGYSSRPRRGRALTTAIVLLVSVFLVGNFLAFPVVALTSARIIQSSTIVTALPAIGTGLTALGYVSVYGNGIGDFRVRNVSLKSLPIVFGGVVALLTLQVGVTAVAQLADVPLGQSTVALTDTTKLPYFLPVAVILVPIVEELFYRDTIQRRLTGPFGRTTAVFTASLLFTFPHVSNFAGSAPLGALVRFSHVFLSGIILGLLYARYRNTSLNIGVHALFNLIVIASTYIG